MDIHVKKEVFSLREDKLGSGEVQFCWQPGSRWLAACGETKVVIILDRLGKKVVEFQLTSLGKVRFMEFDAEGDTLAILQENCSKITIINVHSKKVFEMEIERNNKDRPLCIKWSKKESYLAVCTELGLIYIYNKITAKLIPCAMCHSKSIFSCDWNDEGNLVTGSDDKSISVTGKLGNAVIQGVKLKEVPKMIKWIQTKSSEKNNIFTTVSAVLANKSILVYDISKKITPFELGLKDNYGSIVTYQWFGDCYIAVGFSKGSISILSTHETEMKNEIKMIQPFKTGIDDIAVCDEVNRLAVAGENMIKIYDIRSYEEILDEKIEIPFQAGRINKISWSNSGHILVVSTLLGGLFAFNVVVNEAYAVSSKSNKYH